MEQLLAQGFDALEKRDPELATAAVGSDSSVDRIERDIQELTIQMIARRQPMASDLRHIMTVLKIAGDLERIGDLSKNIAKRALAISGKTTQPLMRGCAMGICAQELQDVLVPMRARCDKAEPCGATMSASTHV